MSRVKRARAGEDIVINRDDDGVSGTEKPMLQNGGESVAGAEMKAESEKGDMGTLAMFGAPPKRGETVSGSGSGSGSGTGSDTLGSLEEAEAGVKRREGERADEEEDEFELSPAARRPSFANRRVRTRYAMEREADEDPPYNVLADHPNRIEHQDYEGQYPEAHQTHQKHHHHQADEEAAVEGTRSRSSASKPELLTAASGASRPRSSSDAPSRDSAKEAKYCKHDQIQTWQEGRKVGPYTTVPLGLRGCADHSFDGFRLSLTATMEPMLRSSTWTRPLRTLVAQRRIRFDAFSRLSRGRLNESCRLSREVRSKRPSSTKSRQSTESRTVCSSSVARLCS